MRVAELSLTLRVQASLTPCDLVKLLRPLYRVRVGIDCSQKQPWIVGVFPYRVGPALHVQIPAQLLDQVLLRACEQGDVHHVQELSFANTSTMGK